MTDMREAVRDAVYDAQNRNLGAAGIARAALSLMQPEIDRRVAEERAKLLERVRNFPIGAWLSATLDDHAVCEEMKADIRIWFDALENQP